MKSIPKKMFIDKSKDVVPYKPESSKMAKYDKNKWRQLFPEGADLTKLQLTEQGIYSISQPRITAALLAALNDVCVAYGIISAPDAFGELSAVETNAGFGGFSIGLARVFGRLNLVEVNPVNAKIIKNNLQVYGFDDSKCEINIITGDYLAKMFDVCGDIIISDLPWGGPEYRKKKTISLGLNNVNIVHIINELYARKLFKIYCIFVPFNFDLQFFVQNLAAPRFVVFGMGKHYFISVVGII